MKPQVVIALIVLAGAGAGLAYLVSGKNPGATGASDRAASKPAVFPALSAKANDVAEIVVKRAELTFTIKREGETWRVVDKGNYPAKFDTVRSFIVALAQLKELEPKTTNPEQFSKLGVNDPVAPAVVSDEMPMPTSTLVTLKDAKGETVAAAVLGNPKWGTSPGVYLRRAGENQTWLAEGRVDVQREPMGWIETKIADVGKDRVKSVVITHPDTQVITIARDRQADKFTIKEMPEERELKDPGVPETIASTLAGLTMQDVASIASIHFAGDDSTRAGPEIELRTFDGLVIRGQSATREGKSWWAFVAEVDESIASEATPPAHEGELRQPSAGTLEGLKREAAELNTRWSAYAFAPVDWKVRSLGQTMDELLKEPGAPAAAAHPAAPALPPGMTIIPPPGSAPADDESE